MKKFAVALSLILAVGFPLLVGCAKKEAEAPKTEQAPAPVAPENPAAGGQAPAEVTPGAGGTSAEQPAPPAAK